MIYTLAVFLPWVAFSLKGRIFSAIFSFILWVILCFPFVLTVAIVIFPHSNLANLGLNNTVLTGLTGFTLQIIWFCSSFFFVDNIDYLVLFSHAFRSEARRHGTTY